MNEAEIKAVVKYYDENKICQHKWLKPAIQLCQAWLARKWPEKMICSCSPGCSCDEINGIINACRLASVVSEEDIFKVLQSKEIKEGGPNPDFYLREQAHAIAEAVNKGEGNE